MDVAAIPADGEWQVRPRQLAPLALTAFDEHGLLRAELVFQCLSSCLRMQADRGRVEWPAEWQGFTRAKVPEGARHWPSYPLVKDPTDPSR